MMPMTGTTMMKTVQIALATPPWSLRRKLSMSDQITVQTQTAHNATNASVQKTFKERIVGC